MYRFGRDFRINLLLITLMVCVVSACGMKGDLYLPENTPQVQTQDKAAQEKEKEKKPQQNGDQPAANNADDSTTAN